MPSGWRGVIATLMRLEHAAVPWPRSRRREYTLLVLAAATKRRAVVARRFALRGLRLARRATPCRWDARRAAPWPAALPLSVSYWPSVPSAQLGDEEATCRRDETECDTGGGRS